MTCFPVLEHKQVQRELEAEDTLCSYWKKRALCAEEEVVKLKERCVEAERWAKRQVDDNRANASFAWAQVAKAEAATEKAEEATRHLYAEVKRLRFELTFVPKPSVPREDLLPLAPGPSQTPVPSQRAEAEQRRNKARKVDHKENKRAGALKRQADAVDEQLAALEEEAEAYLAEQGAAAWEECANRDGGIS